MAVLITGGCGHIASWTAYYLAQQNQDIVLADVSQELPAHLSPLQDRITLESCNVLSLADLNDVIQRHRGKIDTIIHTVAVMGEFVQQHPHRNVQLNIQGFLNVLETAKQFGIRKVVYTSTGAVYGALEGIARESAHLPDPADLYSATKASAEYIGLQYGSSFDIDVRIARVYFVYGPGKLPSDFIELYRVAFGALEGLNDLEMEKGREQELDFTYVGDVGRGVALLTMKKNPSYQVYNIATGQPHTVGEVADICAETTSYDVSAKIGPGRKMPRCSALDITRAKEDLGFEPETGLRDGIQVYNKWIKEQLGEMGAHG